MISNNIPAGWYRDFSFMDWPAFKPSRWEHIRREAEKKITLISEPVIFASDIEKSIGFYEKNFPNKSEQFKKEPVFIKNRRIISKACYKPDQVCVRYSCRSFRIHH